VVVKLGLIEYNTGDEDKRSLCIPPTTSRKDCCARMVSPASTHPPIYAEPVEGPRGSPELLKEFPLVFNSGARIPSAFRSQHLNIPDLLKMQPEPNVLW
jgi:hypothetical protein